MTYMDLDNEQLWQVVGALAGVVGAIAAVAGLARTKVGQQTAKGMNPPSASSGASQYLFFLLVGTLGWGLCVLAFVWFFEPFGSFVTMSDYKKIYATILAFPALGLLRFATFFLPHRRSTDE